MSKRARSIAEIEVLYRQHGAALLLLASAISGDRGPCSRCASPSVPESNRERRSRPSNNKKAYLFACVRNAVLNDAKLQDRNMPLDIDSAWFSPPDRDYAGERNLRRALGDLPNDQREVIVLHVWGELTFSEIGDLLGTSSNTAASRYRYALAKLRGAMVAKENSCANCQ